MLALATDLHDLRARLGRIVLATRVDGTPVTAEDLGVAGAMTVLLRDAIKPNLLQTLEGGPAFVHCGPFANIAHGNNSIIADRLALVTNDIVCTEAGFGADMGAEKFFDIKCRASGLAPDAAVVVATVRALKMHGGVGKIVAGKPLDPALLEENVEAVRTGASNLAAHIEIVRKFGIPAVVAINAFPTDTPAEVEAIREVALAAGARDAVVATHFVDGGAGRGDLAEAVWAATRGPGARVPAALPGRGAARREDPTRSRPRSTARDGIELTPAAQKSLKQYEALGFGHLPVCMAKTQYSLSHDASLKGRPSGLHGADPRDPPVGRRRLHHAAVRRDADDAGPAVRAGRREHRHRRRRERRRAVLAGARLRRDAARRAPSATPSTTRSPAPPAISEEACGDRPRGGGGWIGAGSPAGPWRRAPAAPWRRGSARSAERRCRVGQERLTLRRGQVGMRRAHVHVESRAFVEPGDEDPLASRRWTDSCRTSRPWGPRNRGVEQHDRTRRRCLEPAADGDRDAAGVGRPTMPVKTAVRGSVAASAIGSPGIAHEQATVGVTVTGRTTARRLRAMTATIVRRRSMSRLPVAAVR